MTRINKTIAVCNQKGGVAKTTSTAAISSELARRGYKVLMIDLDSQGSLSKVFLKTDPEETIADTLNDGIYPIVNVTDLLDIIPCNTDISSVAQAMNEPDDRKILDNLREYPMSEFSMNRHGHMNEELVKKVFI